jgi:hypothetical protein
MALLKHYAVESLKFMSNIKLKKVFSELMVVWCESSTVQIDSCVVFVECYGVCFRMCFIRVVKLRRMMCVGHVACMRNGEEVHTTFY